MCIRDSLCPGLCQYTSYKNYFHFREKCFCWVGDLGGLGLKERKDLYLRLSLFVAFRGWMFTFPSISQLFCWCFKMIYLSLFVGFRGRMFSFPPISLLFFYVFWNKSVSSYNFVIVLDSHTVGVHTMQNWFPCFFMVSSLSWGCFLS